LSVKGPSPLSEAMDINSILISNLNQTPEKNQATLIIIINYLYFIVWGYTIVKTRVLNSRKKRRNSSTTTRGEINVIDVRVFRWLMLESRITNRYNYDWLTKIEMNWTELSWSALHWAEQRFLSLFILKNLPSLLMNFSRRKGLSRFLSITSGRSNEPTYRILVYISVQTLPRALFCILRLTHELKIIRTWDWLYL